jgi:hypothetical protein
VVEFRGMGIADEEIVHYEGEGSEVGVVAEEHGGGSFIEAVLDELRRATRWSWDKRPD